VCLDALGACFGVVVANVVESGAALQSRPREKPVQVRVRELARETTALARLARRPVGVLAQEYSSEPEREALLPDAARAIKEQACGKPVG
jgi:hypothetical protein